MADKNIQMKQRNDDNTAWDALYPKTKATNVIANSGNDLETELSQLSIVQTAGGNATAITLTGILLSNGYSKTFIVKTNNGGAATTINGINLFKPNTTSPVKLTAGKAVTVWYSLADNCFFLKASAEGSALASQVLTGVTFSNDDETGIIGTMPNNGTLNSTIASAGGSYTIPSGYVSGGTITAPSLAAVTSSGTVTNNNQILSGYKAISNGTLYTGTIASKGVATYTPTTTNQSIAAGQYLSGIQTILGDADLIASNIISGKNIFGVGGTATITSLGGAKYAYGNTDSVAYNTTVAYNLGWKPDFLLVKYLSKGSSSSDQKTCINAIGPNINLYMWHDTSGGDGGFSSTPNAIITSTGFNITGYYYSSPMPFTYFAVKYS